MKLVCEASSNAWLEALGYEPRSPDDWDPMKAPVVDPDRRRGTAPRQPGHFTG